MSEKKSFIGIDLGTTYSCAGTYSRNGKVEIITNEHGARTTPSYVSFDENERYIGESAKNQSSQNSANTVFDIKRLIGRKFDDATIQKDLDHYPFKIVKGKNNIPEVEVTYMDEKKRFRPEEISAMMLQKIKSSRAKWLFFNAWSSPYETIVNIEEDKNYLFGSIETLHNKLFPNTPVEYWSEEQHTIIANYLLHIYKNIYS
jgi:hypothetical protein